MSVSQGFSEEATPAANINIFTHTHKQANFTIPEEKNIASIIL